MSFTGSRVAAPESTTRGRTVEQRIAVRWPELAALAGASFARLPRGSRLRRAYVERTVRAGYEAWNRDDMETARAYADPEVEVYVAQGSDLPVGLDDAYYGPDGYCRAMEEWAEAWRDWHVEVEEVVEVGQDKFLVTGRHFGEGLASGAKLEQWSAAMYTIRRGKIVRVDMFFLADKDSVSETVRSLAEGGVGAEAAKEPSH
jgi:ketosteroid isomerase-like protein